MRRLILTALLALALAGCQKASEPSPPQPATQQATETSSEQPQGQTPTIARICRDGTRIYGPPRYAIWESNHWTYLDEGQTLDTVCSI